METLNVQFADATEAAIITYFASPQDPAAYENLGTVTTSDPRWKAFYDANPFQWMLPEPTIESVPS